LDGSDMVEPIDTQLFCFKKGKLVACTESEFYGVAQTEECDSLDEYLEKLGFQPLDHVGANTHQLHAIYVNNDTYIFILDINFSSWHGVRADGAIEYITFVRDWLNPLILHQSHSESDLKKREEKETQALKPIIIQQQVPAKEKNRRPFRISLDRQHIKNTTVSLKGEI